MIARAIAARQTTKKRPPLEKSAAWVKLDAGATLPANRRQRLALIVRAYVCTHAIRCGCRDCDATIQPGELFTLGNQHDERGKYPRCYVCMPFAKADEGGPR